MQDGWQPPSLTVRDSQRNGPAFEAGQIAEYLLFLAAQSVLGHEYRSSNSARQPLSWLKVAQRQLLNDASRLRRFRAAGPRPGCG